MAKKEAEQAAQNAQAIINGIVKVLTIGVMIMYRRLVFVPPDLTPQQRFGAVEVVNLHPRRCGG